MTKSHSVNNIAVYGVCVEFGFWGQSKNTRRDCRYTWGVTHNISHHCSSLSLGSQEGAVKVLYIPSQLVLARLALRHVELLVVLGHGEALPADGVPQEPGVAVPGPPLVAPGPVTWVEDHIGAGVVQTRVVTPDLPSLTPQPVLVTALHNA